MERSDHNRHATNHHNDYSIREDPQPDELPDTWSKNCDLYLGNDTGFLHIACALEIKCLALFMDSPVLAYGKYSKYISIIIPEGETEETTTHDTLGKEKISFEKVYAKAIELLN